MNIKTMQQAQPGTERTCGECPAPSVRRNGGSPLPPDAVSREQLYRTLKNQIRQELQERRQVEDQELTACIHQAIEQAAASQYLPLKKRLELKKRLFDGFRRLDILQELVDDPQVTEIMVNGKDHIFLEKQGKLLRWNQGFEEVSQLEDMIQQIVSRINRVVNVSHPIVDARLENGSRVHVVLPPVALDGPVVTIRKFPEPITVEKLIQTGSLTGEAAEFLERLVKAGYNIFISGGTGSGKTSFLNAMSAFIPPQERIITIEDSAELQIRQIPNLVRLETRNANAEGEGAVEISDLIRAALRMRPEGIRIKKGKSKRNKKRFSIPYTLRKHFFCNLIALFSAELLKIIQ